MAENNYDLEYTGSMVDRILDTGYDLQNQGYIFRGLASHYTGTPTERTWLIAPTGSTGFGLSSPVPPGSIGICMYNGSSWYAEVLNTLTLDTSPTTGSGNGITSGAVKTLAESITNAIGQLEQSVSDRFTSLTLEDTTGSLQAELLSITLKYVFEGETESLTSISILAATAEKAGLMSATDKQKLDAFITNIRSLRIQDTTAQDDQGSEITNTLKWTIGGVTEAITAFTLYAATTSKAGLMSAADKTALDTLPSLINAGYLYAGIATPSTVPSSTSAKIFYLAIEGGTYTGFNLNVTQGINIIYKSGDAWSVAQVVGIDNEPTAGSDNLVKSGGVASMYGSYVENPEFVFVKTDKDDKILCAIKADGSIYYGAGCPQQVKDYIDEKLAGLPLDEYDDIAAFLSDYLGNDTTLKVLIDGINERIPELVENPEWLDVKTDNDGKVLEGINKNGEKIFGTMPPQIKEYVDEEIDKVADNIGDFVILNPYEGIASKIRQRAISHEHIKKQEVLEAAINRGIDILCISNYTPGVPTYPAEGFSTDYVEWEFVKDSNGNIIYERYNDGTIKTKLTRNNVEYKVPALKRVVKTLTGGFTDFTKENGERCIVADLTQLPNAEHAHYTLAREWEAGGLHINFIGSTWAEAVNGNPEDTELATDIAKFNNDNGYNFNMQTFHAAFPLCSLQDVLVHTQYNWLYQQLIFGTINHPGFTGMRYWQVDELMKTASRFLKGMEIYNNGETPAQAEYSIQFYDKMLMRGYEFWCLAVDDWGNPNHEYNPNNPERRGCNLMYLPSNYNSMGKSAKRKAVLEAYFSGSFAASGYGLDIDIASVIVQGAEISITFNQIPDKTIIDIDGVRTEGGAVQTLRATATADNTFIRFEAYKGDDFLFTQPFYIKRNNTNI